MTDLEREAADLIETILSSWQAYSKYKKSGVEWLDEEIPSHWQIVRLKNVCSMITDGSHSSPIAQDEGLSYVTVRNVTDWGVNLETAAKISVEDFNLLERNGCRPQVGDVLLSKDGTIGKAVVVQRDDFVVLSSLAILRPIKNLASPIFLSYFLTSPLGIDQMLSWIAGAALRRLTLRQIVELTLTLPPLQEQYSIATFLDGETAHIDLLIAKKHELITLLQEQRNALISHTVTKGLNPNPPMKDSGVEWFGNIPIGWKPIKLKYLAHLGNGSTPLKDNPDYWQGGNYPWLTSTVVNGSTVSQATEYVTPLALRECHLPIVAPDSVLMAITGQGKTRGMVSLLTFEATINQHLVYITPHSDILYSTYLQYFLSSVYEILRMLSEGAGSTRGALTVQQIAEFIIFLPPKPEQSAIVTFLNQETSKIDSLIAKTEETIASLQEYRAALISAAVTGKIDVRNEV